MWYGVLSFSRDVELLTCVHSYLTLPTNWMVVDQSHVWKFIISKKCISFSDFLSLHSRCHCIICIVLLVLCPWHHPRVPLSRPHHHYCLPEWFWGPTSYFPIFKFNPVFLFPFSIFLFVWRRDGSSLCLDNLVSMHGENRDWLRYLLFSLAWSPPCLDWLWWIS